MLDDKLAATDWEATQEELIQQVARESYWQWLRDTNQQHKDNKTVRSRTSFILSRLFIRREINVSLFFYTCIDAVFECVVGIGHYV